MKHFNVLTMGLNLVVGVWAVVEFRQRARLYAQHRLSGLWLFLVFYNALAVVSFLGAYGQSNLNPDQLAGFSFWYRFVDWPVLAALVLGVHISLYVFIFRRRERALPLWLVPVAGLSAVAVLAWYFLAMKYPALAPPRPDNTYWLALIWPPGLIDIACLGWLLAASRKEADPGRRKVDAAFAWLFLARYPVHLALTVWNPAGAEIWALALTKLLGLYTNLAPLVWLKGWFLPWAGGLGQVLATRFDLPAIGRARGLTAREMEILELMIDGKSYKEIETALHISIHTVKSHVYSLYRKMDVKSRHQLIHRIGVYGGEGGPARSA
ncbi:MAG: helix-turn-helix transcriptional regulator [Candidatus Aminicenantes bacterium]|nr:helix-turn-helix transcriptional regulator [Candidatus Aminicenantes bacterium]NLH77787.1 helix-turn-helix transcriptional regulator [Acidobacteriota bacterium]